MAHVGVDNEQIACIQGTIIVTTLDKVFVVPATKMLIYQNGEWYMQDLDYHLFAPILAEVYEQEGISTEGYFIQVHANERAEEQQLKVRTAPAAEDPQNPEIPTEAFELSGDTDTPLSEPYIIEEGISVPVISVVNSYEISSAIDDATPPPTFHVLDEISVPALVPSPDIYEINSAYDNTTPPPSFNP